MKTDEIKSGETYRYVNTDYPPVTVIGIVKGEVCYTLSGAANTLIRRPIQDFCTVFEPNDTFFYQLKTGDKFKTIDSDIVYIKVADHNSRNERCYHQTLHIIYDISPMAKVIKQ